MKFFKSAVVTAVALCAVPSPSRPARWTKSRRTARSSWPPKASLRPFNFFEWHQADGFRGGSGRAGGQEDGPEAIEWKTLGFDALLTGLRQDRWDLVIASHGITEERSKAVTFTNPALLLGRHDRRHGRASATPRT